MTYLGPGSPGDRYRSGAASRGAAWQTRYEGDARTGGDEGMGEGHAKQSRTKEWEINRKKEKQDRADGERIKGL